MLFYINISFTLISLLLFRLSPEEYSYQFCLTINILFIVQNLIYFILRRNRSLVGFQFLFMIAFYFTNFVYPVFYFVNNPTFSIFEYTFNYDIISKATSIAYVAYSFYFLGMSIAERNEETSIEQTPEKDYSVIASFSFRLTVIALLLYIISGGIKAMGSLYSGDGEIIEQGISAYFYMLLFSSATVLSAFVFNVEDKTKQILYLIFIAGIILLLVFIGTRTMPLALCLILMISFSSKVKKIPNSVFLSLLIFGAIFLTFIMFARSSSIGDQDYTKNAIENVDLTSVWDIGSDLIINNRSLYTLIDFADDFGHTYGLNLIGGIFSPIPYLQGFFCSAFNVPTYLISSATFNTFLEFGPDFSWGIGTNVVSDIYLAFGMFGIAAFFTFLGWIISKSELRSNNNLYWNIIYLLFVSNSVYLVRSGFFDGFRTFVWSLLIVYLLELLRSKLDNQKNKIEIT
ncbi:MAG: O-antigen polymerase [Paludibacter sp.]